MTAARDGSLLDKGYLKASAVLADARCSYRQLEYWSRTGLLEYEQTADRSSGVSRLYPPVEVHVARLLVTLSNAGLIVSSRLAVRAIEACRASEEGTVVDEGPLSVWVPSR